ncbi:hypothetical protein U8V72_11005 [Priestia filamentosa]|uniref:hypothetical protein n=1 Tax=Priestia filamentosa TaxID=1402861 RepID=UPI00397D8E37
MKRSFLLLAIVAGFFSSSFFMEHEDVHAEACSPGSYSKTDIEEEKKGMVSKSKCVSISDSGTKSNLKDDINSVANGSDIGTAWDKKFARFMIILSVGLSYATQVFAALTIVYSAFLYSTSEGELRKVSTAKQLIILAFAGMFISTFALIIIKMIGGAVA